ncbi:hypothetical protein [Staphylococcus saprophyticus]|uniref:hypothetical protein n=1 Tax=Staphylococcus saprophyticus TaxID=29385 RepID=UPI0030177051
MNNEIILLVVAVIVALIFVGQLICLLYINFLNKEYLITAILLLLIVLSIIAVTRYVIDYF